MNLEIRNTAAHAPRPDFNISTVDFSPSGRAIHSVSVLQSMKGP